MLKYTESTSNQVVPQAAAGGSAPGSSETYAMPATEGQLRFWSLDQLNPGNPALNMPLMWRCTGPLNVAALNTALSLCVERHEVLRATFSQAGGRLSQVIHPAYPVNLPLVDLEALPGEARHDEAERLTREHAAFRMDLSKGPLLEVKLLRHDRTHHLLLVTMHHIICDGISNGILLRDMVVFYEALIKGTDAQLPELPIQFADFALWQEQWLASEESTRSLEFWRDSLGSGFSRIQLTRDADAVSALAERRERWTGDIETLLIPPALQARSNAFCKRENVTLNMLLFSIFGALLNRLTGQLDLVIGSPCANRNEDTEELIGLFMNIQVMRLQLTEEETFRSLLTKVQNWTLGAYENQELPFERLVHDPYYASGTDSFEIPIFFLYQKSFMITHEIGGLEIVPLRSESPGAVFEMMFAIVDRLEEGPRLQLEYNPRYFKVSTIERYLQMFVALLDAALADPESRLAELNALTREEKRRLLLEGNETAVDFGAFESVHRRFMKRAQAEPDRPTVECAGVVWSAGELAGYARGLMLRLRAEGVQPGDRIGIAVERSCEMLGAVLAVMMAGAAYVPLDPNHPRERLERVLGDSGAKLLLTSRELGLKTPAREILIGNVAAVGPFEDGIEDEALTPETLAYVIYTSGSTGQPKGVAIEHGALLNLLDAMQQAPGLGSDDVLVAITTLAFDIAALELLLPLVTGARLVIATSAEVQDGGMLLARIEQSGATVLQATPGAWRLLIDAGWTERAPGERGLKALSGGEAMPRELAEKVLDRAGELWNMYGPTETTIWSSATRVERGTRPLRLGPPIANTQFYVLDTLHALAPVGVAGELFIGGSGLARGYWNQAELTAGRFIVNPFGPGRIYATGDLARRLDDGTIELMGRTDFQVKVRGYRIELSEIEGALQAHPRVKESVVTQQKLKTPGLTRLAAYVAAGELTPEQSEALIEELRTLLRSRLPEYMLPSVFVVMPALPRNTNGKIDRKALPDTGVSHQSGVHSTAAAPDQMVGPKDMLESQLVDLWQTTLGISRISVRANFFSLGVGSLAALRLTTKMNRVYGMELGVASLVSASTIESIAEMIHKRFAPNTSSSLVPLQPLGSKPPLFIVHGVGGNVVNFYGLATRMGTDQPVYGIQAQALVANQPALLRLADMATHYIEDMRTLQPTGPYHLLGYSFGGTVALEMAHQLRALGEEVAVLGMIDSKSKDYEEQLASMDSTTERVNARLNRFKGNTERLSWTDRRNYIWEKISTRAIRFSCMAAARMNFKKVPAFMRSAYDINYVAVQNYKPKPISGKLVLFRASEQDTRGAHDLGWGSIFSDGIEIYDLTGDHERIFLEPNIDLLAASLKQCLARR